MKAAKKKKRAPVATPYLDFMLALGESSSARRSLHHAQRVDSQATARLEVARVKLERVEKKVKRKKVKTHDHY